MVAPFDFCRRPLDTNLKRVRNHPYHLDTLAFLKYKNEQFRTALQTRRYLCCNPELAQMAVNAAQLKEITLLAAFLLVGCGITAIVWPLIITTVIPCIFPRPTLRQQPMLQHPYCLTVIGAYILAPVVLPLSWPVAAAFLISTALCAVIILCCLLAIVTMGLGVLFLIPILVTSVAVMLTVVVAISPIVMISMVPTWLVWSPVIYFGRCVTDLPAIQNSQAYIKILSKVTHFKVKTFQRVDVGVSHFQLLLAEFLPSRISVAMRQIITNACYHLQHIGSHYSYSY